MKRYLILLAALLVAGAAFAAPQVNSLGINWRFLSGQGTALTLQQMTTTANTKIIDCQNDAGTSVTSIDREGDMLAASVEAQHIEHSAGTQTVPDGSTTLAVAAGVSCIPVAGTGGATTLGGTPLITAGTVVGQRLILIGTSDTNTVLIPDSGNVNTTGTITLGLGDTLGLIWNGTAWCETGTSNN